MHLLLLAHELNEKKNIEEKRFLKNLSANFNNKLFESIAAFDFVSVSPKNENSNPFKLNNGVLNQLRKQSHASRA